MKRKQAFFFLLVFGNINYQSLQASCQKCCSSKCSISKNTWLPRSFASYQLHELIAQKKRIQDAQEFEIEMLDDMELLQIEEIPLLQPIFLDQNTSEDTVINNDTNQIEQIGITPQYTQLPVEQKQTNLPSLGYDRGSSNINSLDDLDIFDQNKDYVVQTTPTLAARIEQKVRDFFSSWRLKPKKSVDKNTTARMYKSHAKFQELDPRVKPEDDPGVAFGYPGFAQGYAGHSADHGELNPILQKELIDMQELAEEMREDLQDSQETNRRLFYESRCCKSFYYNSICFSYLMEYMHNFGQKCGHHCKNLGSMPFWSGTNIMTVGNNDGRADLDAYQLGLGNIKVDENGIGGIIELNPDVQYAGADLFFQWTHKYNEPCLYFKLHVPFGSIIIHPNLTEPVRAIPDEKLSFTQITANPNSTEIMFQFPRYPTPFFRPLSVSDAFFGGSACKNRLEGNIAHPISLRKGRIAVNKLSEIRFGDLNFALGYNFVNNPSGYFGVAFKVSCPTSNVPNGDYMLESFFGRAGLWGVGADISGLYNICSNEAGTKYINFGVQGELLHLINGRTPNFRTFDLCANGPGSKYLLVQKYVAAYNHVNRGFITRESIESCIIQPAANITTLPVKSSITVEGSLAVMFDFWCNNWNFDIGGEFWGRSAEKLKIDTRTAVAFRLPNLNDYAVIGRQLSSYLIDGQPNLLNTFYAEPLARINKSQDPVQLIGSPPNVMIPPYANLPAGIVDARIASNRIPADLDEALDICGAQASAVFTGKVFGQFDYTWLDNCYKPSLGIVGGAEFTDNTNNIVQLWSIGVHGSITF